MLLMFSACAMAGMTTWVEGGVRPDHFDFKDVLPKRGKGPGGWRAACLHVGVLRDATSEMFYCKFGVEVPIENKVQGEISLDVARSQAAGCANQAAMMVLGAATPATPWALPARSSRRFTA
jgi:hypothetical protein